MRFQFLASALVAVMVLAAPAGAQAPTTVGEAPDALRVYFPSGSAQVAGDQEATLDQAARLFRDGSPIVMVVAGGADTVGRPNSNLAPSVRRAQAVVEGLIDRGIPADRLQLLGRGNSDLPVETGEGVDLRDNRVVEIT